jgi:hypothetical protein
MIRSEARRKMGHSLIAEVAMPAEATVTAYDPHERAWIRFDAPVLRTVVLKITNSAFGPKYDTPYELEMVITGGGVYFRPYGTDENFREMMPSMNGMALEIVSQTRH